uniref:Kunitz/Bovine pancreatic trypsin inhibitor domain protein n=1 Tax=Rhabditophanes sp. KR3021 TaxID=114890 RepID=A0AC35UA04_9BILA
MILVRAFIFAISAGLVCAQHGTVGRSCEVSTDCGTGNYCGGNKKCACLSTYVEIDSYCWRKISPGESGCQMSRQCDSVWPGAYCRSGECRCANNQPPFRTRDGLVCLNYGFCPLNGNNPKFRIENQVQQCYGGADATCEAIGALAYDCICDSDDCTVNNPISFCCPSRALTCILAPNEGTSPPGGSSILNHWYYDSITSECRELKYLGRNGGIPTEVYNTAGGLPSEYFDVGIPDGSGSVYPRFYYDAREGRCIQFNFLGQGGNFNIFLSEESCSSYCSQILCSAGTPLKDSSGERNMECSPTGNGPNSCPSSHSCEATTGTATLGGICCPKPAYVCKLPKEQGNCGTYSTRWWYNAKTSNCIEFTFSGCQSNANNFETYKQCQDYCSEAKPEPQCIQGTALTDSNGNYIVCGGNSVTSTCPSNSYCYFDPETKTYGCCSTQAYTCQLPAKPGTVCGPAVTRWYYDSTSRSCQTFSFNSCDGNSNNFAVSVRCSSTTITRYHFNPDTKSCNSFNYNGCEGNRNSFPTAKQCENYCYSEACPAGTVIAKEGETDRLVQCTNPGGNGRTSGGCAEGYTCFSSPLLDQNVCCGASVDLQALCPSGSTPFISALTLQPMQCTPNVDGACPGSFFCWWGGSANAMATTSAVNAFYCCKSPDTVDTGYCPPQLVPVPGEGGAQYKYCSPSAPLTDAIQGCGSNRHCQYSSNLERYICCGLEADVRLENICPPQPHNLVPVELAGNYRTCNPYARSGTPQSCPENSACLYTGTNSGFICCRVQQNAGGRMLA